MGEVASWRIWHRGKRIGRRWRGESGGMRRHDLNDSNDYDNAINSSYATTFGGVRRVFILIHLGEEITFVCQERNDTVAPP